MIVGACGFGSTGSSAVTDYLREFNEFQVKDSIEFSWVGGVDGLIDLEYHVNHPHNRTGDSITAIYRYKKMCEKRIKRFGWAGIPKDDFMNSVDSFLDSIITTSWKWYGHHYGMSAKMYELVRLFLARTKLIINWEVKHGRHWEGFPYEDVHLSIRPENFDIKAKNHVMEVISMMGVDGSKPVIFDQPFPGNNPQSCFKYFEDPYAIVVDRDPRDNYVFAKTKLLTKSFSHLMPVNDVKDFVKYYRALRKDQPYTEPNERILSIKFEDMVYHYDETTKRIREFLHLPENPNPKSIFDPLISMPNTQVWKRFPQFEEDIKYIEKELPEYFFDYTGCPEPDPNAKMFVGKSPKNKKK